MLTSLKAFSTRFLTLSALAAMTVGCANLVTYSRDAQQEGMRYYNAGQYTDAAGAFNNAVKQAPDNYEARYYLASSYARTGAYTKAIQAYRATLDAMKVSYEGARDTEFRAKVIDALAQTIAQSPNRHTEMNHMEEAARTSSDPELYIILAKTCQYAGDPDGAIDNYRTASTIAPNHFEVQKQYGLYLDALGQPEATTPLRRANALNPDDLQVADALRKHGIVPGPSLKEPHELAKPLLPDGPLPDWGSWPARKTQPAQAAPAADGAYPMPTATVQHPRD